MTKNAAASDIDWAGLRRAAAEAAQHARSPHSQRQAGAAGLLSSGDIVRGCNLESAAYGLTMCAECGLLGDMQMTDGAELVAISVTDAEGTVLTPCGSCRQLLIEMASPALLVDAAPLPLPLAELRPEAFKPEDVLRQ